MDKKGASWAIWMVVGSILVIAFILMMLFILESKVKPALIGDEGDEFFGSSFKYIYPKIKTKILGGFSENVRLIFSKSIS